MPTTIPKITTPIPPAPSRQEPANFSDQADAFLQWWEAHFDPELDAVVDGMNARGTEIDNTAATTAGYAANALASSYSAQDAAEAAAGSANYAGVWGDLTGALAIPASVLYNNEFWVLVQELDGSPGNTVQENTPTIGSSVWQPANAAILELRVGDLLPGEVSTVNEAGTQLEGLNVRTAVNSISPMIFFSIGV